MIRVDNQDVVYASEREKYDAVADEIVELREKGQPVLVGTVSIEKSERLSDLLKQRGVPHVVLNAKFHEKEAEIVAQAGRSGAVTIATNMAGRGTDIVLGGNRRRPSPPTSARTIEDRERVRAAAREAARGLRRGHGTRSSPPAASTSSAPSATSRGASTTSCAAAPAARATPGSSRFYLSLEDDLMRIFGSDRLQNIMRQLGMEEGDPDRAPAWSRARSSARRSRSRRATSRAASTCSSTTT